MQHKYGSAVEELRFPPRRLFGNFSERVVAERRAQLEVRRLMLASGHGPYIGMGTFLLIDMTLFTPNVQVAVCSVGEFLMLYEFGGSDASISSRCSSLCVVPGEVS